MTEERWKRREFLPLVLIVKKKKLRRKLQIKKKCQNLKIDKVSEKYWQSYLVSSANL